MRNDPYPLVVVGGGPAGLAAATTAADLGIPTLLIDEQRELGGQIYRSVSSTPVSDRSVLGADYWHGASLVEAFRASSAEYLPNATVWSIEPLEDERNGLRIVCSVAGEARMVTARKLIIATGAQERPFPFPGWTMPGVLTAGAAQILLKSSGVVPAGRTVLAGSGPLLYLLAWQYLNAEVAIDAILETTPRGQLARAIPHLGGFLRSPYFAKGLMLKRAVERSVRVVRHVEAIEATGEGAVRAVRFRVKGSEHELPVEQLLVHHGVVPNINLPQALGIPLDWNDGLACWEPRADAWGCTEVANVSLAGDGAGVAGAQAAEQRGRLAALHVAWSLGELTTARRDGLATAARAALARATRGRRFFDTLYLPPLQFRAPADLTIVCRCEEVTAGEVRAAVSQGCRGPNQLKAFVRCGMGPCQGRFCALTVTEVMAEALHRPPAEIGHFRLRYPTKPVTLGELASLPQTDASRAAVIRFTPPADQTNPKHIAGVRK